MKKSLIILASLAIVASCAKEEVQIAKTETIQEITAVMEPAEDAMTKAALESNIVEWEVNDSIIVSDGDKFSKFVCTNVTDGVGTFTLKAGEAEITSTGTIRAWYPCSIAPEGVGQKGKLLQQQITTNGTAPEGQKINYAPSKYTANPMYATGTNGKLQFKNLCGLVKVHIENPGDDIAIAQVIMESYNKPLHGSFSVTSNAAVLDDTGEAGYRRIATKNTNSKFVSAVPDYYIAVPAGTYDDCEFILQTNQKLFQNFRLKEGKTLTIERNKIYTVKVTADDITTYTSLDKGNNSTANCYICTASATGKYQFKATKGNQAEYIKGIDHVGIVWKSQGGKTDELAELIVKNVSYKNGYIRFETTNNQGNALIAAYDKNGTILWSWHIWACSKTPADVKLSENVSILDRNIGALNTTWDENSSGFCSSHLSSGCYFQWGRKDPFVTRTNSANVQMPVYGTAKEVVASQATIDESIKNPTVFYAAGATTWSSQDAATWAGETKSVYDPCPYGYRVPAKADFEAVWTADNLTIKKGAKDASTTSILGWIFKTATSDEIWFPTTGQIKNDTGGIVNGTIIKKNDEAATANTDTWSRLWTRDSDADSKHIFIDGHIRVPKDKTILDESNKTVRFSAVIQSYGMAVRCVKE